MLKTKTLRCELPEFTEEEMIEMNELFEKTLAMLVGKPRMIQGFVPFIYPGAPLFTINE
jgi:hypothetical protein